MYIWSHPDPPPPGKGILAIPGPESGERSVSFSPSLSPVQSPAQPQFREVFRTNLSSSPPLCRAQPGFLLRILKLLIFAFLKA